MRKNCGITAEMSNEKIKKLIEAISLKAFADEGGSGDDPDDSAGGDGGVKTPTINYEDLIAKARKEEKEKQYKTIEKLKGQVATLTEQHNNDLLVKADLEKAKKDLEDKVSKFEGQKPVNREEVEAEVRAELEKEYEVKTYKVEKMAEYKDDILVPELVMGTTKEEIDASIQSALERSKQIRESLGISDGTKTKKKTTPKTPANPSSSSVQNKDISLERLATMDVRSPEYAELRKQLGLH